MEYLKVEGHNNLVRDPITNSIVNTNMTEYQQYLIQREIKNKENLKVENIEQDVANMKEDLNEIKLLLKNLINGLA